MTTSPFCSVGPRNWPSFLCRVRVRDLLRFEVEENAVSHACGVIGLGGRERHEAAIRGDHWIGSFPARDMIGIDNF
ncbi:MAG TPA: hypothetical protein VF740_04865 [Candidatus Acidoferrum sp.]